MRNSFFTLTFLLLASILIYACGNETDNPVLTEVSNTETLAFSSPHLQGDAEDNQGWHHHLGDNDAQLMNGLPMDISIEKVEVDGKVVEVFQNGNFTLQTETEEIFVMLHHHRGNRQPVFRHHGMGRGQNVANNRNIEVTEGIEVGAKVTVAGYLMAHTIQNDEERIVNRLLATEITKDGKTIYIAEDDDFWHCITEQFDDEQ